MIEKIFLVFCFVWCFFLIIYFVNCIKYVLLFYKNIVFICINQVVEIEVSREVVRKEFVNFQRKMGELIDEFRLKEKDYQMVLEDSCRVERKLEDQRRNLEINMENINVEVVELKLRLSGLEGRVNVFEVQFVRIEGVK